MESSETTPGQTEEGAIKEEDIRKDDNLDEGAVEETEKDQLGE